MDDAAPRPTPGLAVAIVGHRADRIEDPAKVKERLGEILAFVIAQLESPGGLRLVSALAEGADRIAASAALEAGISLEAVLPFPSSEYAEDFVEAGPREEFYALLARSDSVLVMDGPATARDKAYDAAGRALLDNCDLLLAVWDGQPGRGRGGTREVIAEAARRGLPIVTISPDGASTALLHWPANSGPVRLQDRLERPVEELAHLLSALVGEAALRDLDGYWLAQKGLPSRSWLYAAYPLLLRLVGQGSKRKRQAAGEPPPPIAEPALRRAFNWWDGTAICAAQAFRSAVIVNFALAALAVLLAVGSLLAGGIKWLFVLAEVTTIMLLLANAWYAGRQRWQERWLESREIAEMLRVCLLLRGVGIGRPIADDGQGSWSVRYVRAFAREARLLAVDLSDATAAFRPLREDISGQAAWNEATALRMHRAGHRIGHFGEALFLTVLAAAIGWLTLRVIDPGAAGRLTNLLTAITAGFPAVATASYGIRLILDFEGVGTRAGRMAGALRALLAEWEGTSASAASLQDFARRAADIMLGDVAAWRLLAEGRRLAIPG
jgi:hypothetical protein